MPIDKRRRSSSSGGGGGKGTNLLAALFGKGGQASTNTAIDPEQVPELEGSYINRKGKVTDSPFSSNYNFFDRLAGRSDEAKTLEAQIALNSILGNQNIEQALRQAKGLVPIEAEKTEKLGEIKKRQSLEEAGAMVPIKGREERATFYGRKGLADDEISPIAPLNVEQNRSSLEANNRVNAILNSVLSDPANQQLLQQATLAKESLPIGALRRGMETSIGPNELFMRGGTGNAFLDKALNPGIGYGSTKQDVTTLQKFGDLQIPTTKSVTTPGSFRGQVPIDPDIKARVLQPADEVMPQIPVDRSAAFKVPPLNTQLIPADGARPAEVPTPGPSFDTEKAKQDWKILVNLLNWIKTGGSKDLGYDPLK